MTKLIVVQRDEPLPTMVILKKLILTNFAPPWNPPLRTETSSRAALADLAWFEANPDRRHHVRPALKGDDELGMAELVVVRKDKAGLRPIPVLADFLVPDKEEFAETAYVMSLTLVVEIARAAAAGKFKVKSLDMDEFAAGVDILWAHRRFA